MRFLKALFRQPSNDSSVALPMPGDAETPSKAVVSDHIFIEKEPPISEGAHAAGRIAELARRDLTQVGIQAGFEHHDMEVFRLMREQFKAEIMQALDARLECLEILLSKYDEEISKLEGEGMTQTLRGIQASRTRYDRERMRLVEQRMLVLGNSGIAELSLTTFELGFKQGYSRYLESLELIAKYQA